MGDEVQAGARGDAQGEGHGEKVESNLKRPQEVHQDPRTVQFTCWWQMIAPRSDLTVNLAMTNSRSLLWTLRPKAVSTLTTKYLNLPRIRSILYHSYENIHSLL